MKEYRAIEIWHRDTLITTMLVHQPGTVDALVAKMRKAFPVEGNYRVVTVVVTGNLSKPV